MGAFVYEGYVQRGGTYMAYHLGLVLHRHFGLPVRVVGSPLPAAPQFDYPVVFPVVGHEEFVAGCGADDLLICNPSFSHHMFGLTLPCRKLSYVQGVATFSYLDGFFDHYVFQSRFVKAFVENLYAISGPLIPPFVDVPPADSLQPLARRANRALILEWKTPEPVRRRFLEAYREAAPTSALTIDVIPTLSHGALAAQMRASRYFVSLSILEGFDLPMLEAMGNGCAVLGLTNGGNAEYARGGENCRLVQYPRLHELACDLVRLSASGNEATRLAAAGRTMAESFSYPLFEARWKDFFREIV
jgi:hypothetical protein